MSYQVIFKLTYLDPNTPLKENLQQIDPFKSNHLISQVTYLIKTRRRNPYYSNYANKILVDPNRNFFVIKTH